jgi:hypothetical protein
MRTPRELDVPFIAFPKEGDFPSPVNEDVKITNGESTSTRQSPNLVENIVRSITLLASQSWRLSTVIIDAETEQPRAELNSQDIRKLSNIVEAMQEIIQSLGIRVIDRCGEDFHPGLPDLVVTEEPREGISKERIIRTIRPTILHGQTMVQRGEIDIAVPMERTP